ncbi:MAG: hypothetical protein ABIP28_03450 [Mucilaginibacter sp.]
MIIQFIEVKELLEEFNQIAERSQNIAIFTRDIELQKAELQTLSNFIEKSNSLKISNKDKYSEEELNLILFIIFSIDAVKSELEMVISLKDNKMDLAWSSLVHAQIQISIAATNHPFNKNTLNGYVLKLDRYEKLLFPKMMFASAGYLVKKTKCSICELEYEDCDHLKGKFYNGELCVREIHEAELEEVSLVENPANKLCRALSAIFDGKEVDPLTFTEKK